MKLTNNSAVPVYTVSGSSTARPLPDWLARKRKRSLKNDAEYSSRVELLQDFGFDEASQCVRISDDGEWVMSTGTYKPQIHTHYLPHLSLSFARHTVSLNKTFLLLSSDYSKSIHLQYDRSIEFHTPEGLYHTTRIPRYGRDVKFVKSSTEVLVPAVGVNEDGHGEVFRLNLELGRFMRSYEIDVGVDEMGSSGAGGLQGGSSVGGVNTAAVAEESHNLLAFGTSLGTVEFWDARARDCIVTLSLPNSIGDQEHQETTAIEFHRNGLDFAIGSSTGIIHLYDLRSPKPLLKRDQGFGYPIQDLIYLTPTSRTREQSSEPKILSSDKRIIKIWNPRDGTPWTSVEPAVDLHSVAWCKDSGMLLTANEGREQHSFFIPQLGPAPKWCSFLDNLVDEMAEDPNDPNAFASQRTGEVYDNYKFLTLQQLSDLNLAHLIGTTTLLRPYMHGYFVDQRLYEEAKMISDPFIIEEQRSKRAREKIEQERESRIRGNKKPAANARVNQRLAEKILERDDKIARRHAKRLITRNVNDDDVEPEAAERDDSRVKQDGLLSDPRFSKLFTDTNFAIDETSHEFRSLNPSTKVKDVVSNKTEAQGRNRLTAAEEEEIDEIPPSSDGDSMEDEENPAELRDRGRISTASYKRSKHKKTYQPRLSVTSSKQPTLGRDRSFGARSIRQKNPKETKRSVVGERELTFNPGRSKKVEVGDRRLASGQAKKDRRSASGNVFRNM